MPSLSSWYPTLRAYRPMVARLFALAVPLAWSGVEADVSTERSVRQPGAGVISS